jgi:hypothetical protein
MDTPATLADALAARGLTPDAVVRVTRYYLAERLDDPAVGELRDDLAERVPDGAELVEVVAQNPTLLLETALGVLSAAWEQEGERERIVRVLDDHGGSLPAADVLPVAATLVYGLFLLARAGQMSEESTTLGADGSYEHRRIERRGALAILLGALAKASDPPVPGPRPGLPGEGNFTVLQLDIQGSGQMSEAEQSRTAIALRDVIEAGLGDLSVRTVDITRNDHGDAWQVLIPDASGGLTPIVSELPGRIRKRLHDAEPDLRVRMGIHCGRLRHEQRWAGTALVHVTRIIDDERIKGRLRKSDRQLLTVLSDRVHDETVMAGYAANVYERATVKVKETKATVWLRLS